MSASGFTLERPLCALHSSWYWITKNSCCCCSALSWTSALWGMLILVTQKSEHKAHLYLLLQRNKLAERLLINAAHHRGYNVSC